MSLFLIAALALRAEGQVAPASAKPDGKKPRMVCVDQTPLGSRLPGKRVCRTADEWELMRRDERDETERAQRLNTIHGG